MDIAQLRDYLDSVAASLADPERLLLDERLKSLISVFPFNEYEYILMFLLDRGVIGFNAYEQLRDNYVSSNRYLGLFELAPRIFGEIWAHEHIMDLDKNFVRPDKSIDPSFEGQYDLWLNGVRVEVKASRAINTKKRGGLISKALRYGTSEPFWMNFQQLKLDTCDVFIFVGVWVDQIVYWVLSKDEVEHSEYRSHQHRGGVEYQIGITNRNIQEFDRYKVTPSEVGASILEKAGTQP